VSDNVKFIGNAITAEHISGEPCNFQSLSAIVAFHQ